MPCQRIELVIDLCVQGLCSRPYPGHPSGCPNFGKRRSCPPQVPLIEKILDLSQSVFAIWNIFDFTSHKQRMTHLHPNWLQRQIECCLYQQNGARKALKNEIDFWSLSGKFDYVLTCPEACGGECYRNHEVDRRGFGMASDYKNIPGCNSGRGEER